MNRDAKHARGRSQPGGGREVTFALVAFALAFVLALLLGLLGRAVGFVAANLGAFVAVVFLYIPFLAARMRGEDVVDYAFKWEPVGRGLALAGGYLLIVFPIFAVGFALFYQVVCDPSSSAMLSKLALPGMCRRWPGWQAMSFPRFDLSFLEAALVQVVVIAIPEELFFRGFIHEMLERAMPPKRRFLGGGVGRALLFSSALFAIGHLAVRPDPRRLAVFFPGMAFGWMRSATGSILAGVIAHASSNLFIHVLERMWF